MKLKLFFLFMVLSVLSVSVQGQVTIGSIEVPDKNSLLDLKENSTGTSTKGLLPPRVALQSTTLPNPLSSPVTAGMVVYNTATAGDVTPGYYYHDGTKWLRMAVDGAAAATAGPNFFYMPAIILPIDPADPTYNAGTETFTVDLYARYQTQFATPPAASPNAASAPLPLYAKGDLKYFITYYDSAVFSSVSVNNDGVMTYKLVASPAITEKTYMNIIFEVK